MPQLRVHLLPQLVDEADLAGRTCVVIDVLRASTTIVHALAAGARGVVPCLTVEDAQRAAASLPHGDAVLAGERGGRRIGGFQLGNSPSEFTPQSVGGRTVVFTTTNGTKALLQCRQASAIYVAALVNAAAVCDVIVESPQVDILCAGTDGRISYEDVLCAGLLTARLRTRAAWEMNDQATIARDVWNQASELLQVDGDDALAHLLTLSHGGRNLVSIGMAQDIQTAARLDIWPIVPRFLSDENLIVA